MSVVKFNPHALYIDHYFIFAFNFYFVVLAQFFCSIAAKHIDVSRLEKACTGMVTAFIQSHFYQGPLVTEYIIPLHSALTFNEIIATTRIQVPTPADNVYLVVVFNTVREVGSLQIHISPTSESLLSNLEFPILSGVTTTYK